MILRSNIAIVITLVFSVAFPLGMLIWWKKKTGEKKYLWLYPVAILIHAMIDAPAALYQYQVISSIFVVEGVALAMGIICLLLGIRTLRRR